jgi:hypothetical protein
VKKKTKFTDRYRNLSKSEKGDIKLNILVIISILTIVSGIFMACLKIEVPWFELETFGILMTIFGTICAVIFGIIRSMKNIEY